MRKFGRLRRLNAQDTDGSQYREYMNVIKRAALWTCTRCSWTAEKQDRLEIIVHHKDKNRYNNSDSNLVVLCQDCHNLTHGFRLTPARRRIVKLRAKEADSKGWPI